MALSNNTSNKKSVWRELTAILQIYPMSYQDSNGDGYGDLRGIIQRLDYIADTLGVSGIWLSPIYPSPMYDNGYDIMDYKAINSMFGTMEDFDELLEEAHKRNLKVMLDYVPNHTSSLHSWFQESRKSRHSEKRDWYIWKDPKPDGSPPNNWITVGGGGLESAWKLDTDTMQFYMHSFKEEQPDLNWRNPEVVEAMFDVIHFWLKKGVDGFRVDVGYYILKHSDFKDEPENPNFDPFRDHPNERLIHVYSKDQHETRQLMARMSKEISDYGGFMVMEVYVPIEEHMELYKATMEGHYAPFNFDFIFVPWSSNEIRTAVENYLSLLRPNDIPVFTLGNHDQSRTATRLGGQPNARLAAVLQLSLPGLPFIYYGEEIGLEDVPVEEDRKMDTFTPPRDAFRTPMQWDTSEFAGFSTTTPRLPLSQDYAEKNVETQLKDPTSMLHLYKSLLKLRKEEIMIHGKYVPINSDNEFVYTFARTLENEKVIVALNFDDHEHTVNLGQEKAEILLSSFLDIPEDTNIKLNELKLRAKEGIILKEVRS